MPENIFKNKTLYVSDLDGTLLNGSAELSGYSMNKLNTMIEGGLNFTAATARTLASTIRILSGLTLRLPVVVMNGVALYETELKRYVKIESLNPETVASITGILKLHEITGFMYEIKDGELVTYHESPGQKPLRDFMEERIVKYNKKYVHTDGFDLIIPSCVVYFTLLDTYERLKPVCDALKKLRGIHPAMYKDVYSSDLWFLEIFNEQASKKNAVKYLREAYKFERVVGFGDNLNDLPMFESCDVKIATANARPEVQAAADFICGANDDDGVVKWLEKNARYER